MLPRARTWRRAALGAAAATLLVALPAGAHPFVRGGEVPVDSVATVSLAMGHGCGTEDSGGGDPTLEVALEVPEEVRIVEVADDPAYDHELEADDDGRIEIITWTAIDEGEPAPDVEFDAVFSGEVGDELYLRVFQGCDDFAYRWIGTPDAPAEDPAVRVTLLAADPDRPAPAPDEVTPAEATVRSEDEAVDDEEPATDAEDLPADADEPADEDMDADATDDLTTDDADVFEEEGAVGLEGDEQAADDGGFPVLLVVAGAVVLAALAALLMRRAGRGGAGTSADPSP